MRKTQHILFIQLYENMRKKSKRQPRQYEHFAYKMHLNLKASPHKRKTIP